MERVHWALLALASGLFLAFWAALAASSRLAADDFCAADILHQRGLLGMLHWWRLYHTGRWLSQGVEAYFSLLLLPHGQVTIYAAGLLVLLWGACAWALSGFEFLRGQRVKSGIMALLLFAASFVLTPSPSEVWFWISGTSVHSLPVLFLFVQIGILARGRATPFSFFLVGCASLLMGGCSETSIVIGSALLLYMAVRGSSERRRLALFGLGCLGLSAAYAMSAPGNFVRLHSQTTGSSMNSQQFIAGLGSIWHVSIIQKWQWWLLFGALSVGLAPLLKECEPKLPRRLGAAFLFGIPFVLLLSLLPAVVAFQGPIPPRTLAPVTVLSALWFGTICLHFGWRFPALVAHLLGSCAALGVALLFAVWIRKQLPVVRSAARTFDRNYVLIRATAPGCKTLMRVEKPVWQRWVPIGVPEPLPSHWISRCMTGAIGSCPLAQK